MEGLKDAGSLVSNAIEANANLTATLGGANTQLRPLAEGVGLTSDVVGVVSKASLKVMAL